jgi:hypothetical protein
MTWEKSAQEPIDLFAPLAPTAPGVEQKKMFGWPCCFANGNLFASLHKHSMIFVLSEADQNTALRLQGAKEFQPMPGRKMRGYAILSELVTRDRKELARWISRERQLASAWPAKTKTGAANRKTEK